MVRKVCENLERKRELLYSFSTVVFIPVLYYCAVTYAFTSSSPFPKVNKEGEHGMEGGGGEGGGFVQESLDLPGNEGQGDSGTGRSLRDAANLTFDGDILNFIRKRRELPYESVFYIVLLEVVKLFIVLTIYPGNHLFDQTPPLSWVWRGKTGTSPNSSYAAGQGGRAAQGRLPFSKRDRENGPGKSPPLQIKILELCKGICNYVGACALCHLFVTLLGAPIVKDFKITLQFSIILTTWIFSPMCLAVPPGRLLQDLLIISSWNFDNELLHRTKWRFATTVLGAWIGAIVIPLDWDRPWQIWPVPCLVSTIFTFHITHLVLTFHLFCVIYGMYHKMCASTSESSKIKNF